MFAGDSLIQTFEWAEYFSDLEDTVVLNRGISGDTVGGLTARTEINFLAHADPQVFIMVGINDLGLKRSFRLEDFMVAYERLIEKTLEYVTPDRVFIHSLLPVNRPNISNGDVRKANEGLRLYAQRRGLRFVDLFDRYLDSTGRIVGAYYHSDGIHLSAEGYKVWLEVLEPYVRN